MFTLVHSFRTNDEIDKDIEEVLSSLSGKEKSAFIKSAIRFYIEYSKTIERIDSNVSEILNILKNGAILNNSAPDKSEKQTDDEAEKILRDSIANLFEL